MRTRSHPRLHVEDQGRGQPVLAITGWTISSAVFEPVAHLYLPHVHGITYDHRGSGRSAPWLGPVSMAMLAADGARVLDELGVDAAHVVGVSMGGAVALELALRMPHRVRSLVLMGVSAGGPLTINPPLGEVAQSLTGLARDSLRHRGIWPERLLFSEGFRAEHPERVRRLVPPFLVHRAPPWNVGAQTLAAACFDRMGSLKRVRAPTLVVHGGQDAMVPLVNGRVLAARIPDARLEVFADSGHVVAFEQPERTAELVLGWVAEHADAPLPAPPNAMRRRQERWSRPFALHTGTARAQLDAVRRLGGRTPR